MSKVSNQLLIQDQLETVQLLQASRCKPLQNHTNLKHHLLVLWLISVVNFHDYLSDDTAIVCAVCKIMPPAKALVTLETTLTEEQRQGFKFVHKEGGRLDNSAVYCCWSRLKKKSCCSMNIIQCLWKMQKLQKLTN